MYSTVWAQDWHCVCEPAWPGGVRRSAGKRKDAGSTPHRFGSAFSSKNVIYGYCLVTFPCTINER